MNASWAAITDCELCKYTGGGNEEMMNILSYMIDSTGAVHEDEICRQVVEACGAMQPPVLVEKEAVRIHLHEHMLEQRVVLVNVLRGLLHVNSATRRIALCESVACADSSARQREEDDMLSEGDNEVNEGGHGHHVLGI